MHVCMYVFPKTAVRMGFLLAARELVRGTQTPGDGPFGSTARSDHKKNTINVMFFVLEPKRIENVMLFCHRTKTHRKRSAFFVLEQNNENAMHFLSSSPNTQKT